MAESEHEESVRVKGLAKIKKLFCLTLKSPKPLPLSPSPAHKHNSNIPYTVWINIYLCCPNPLAAALHTIF